MRNILTFTLVIFMFSSVCFAEVYLVIDKSTKEIITASEKNDTIISSGQEVVILPGKFENIELAAPITDYKYQGKKFVLNQAKIDADNTKKNEADEKANEKKLIDDKIQKIAVDALKADGVILKYY